MLILEWLLTFITDYNLALQQSCLAAMSTKFNDIRIPILEGIVESNQPEPYHTNEQVHKGETSYHHHHDRSKKITYSRLDLFSIGYNIKHDLRYTLLPSGVCQTVRRHLIAWGKRGGKHISKHIDVLNQLANQDNLIRITINERTHLHPHQQSEVPAANMPNL